VHVNRLGGRQEILDRGERVCQQVLRRSYGVEYANPLGLLAREVVVGRGDRREEQFVLALQPVGLERPLVLTRPSCRRVDAQQQRALGGQAAGGEAVDRAHLRHAQSAPGALVGQRGVDEPIEQDQHSVIEQPKQPLLHELRARGRVEQRLGAWRNRQGRVLDERANPLGYVHSAGLAQQLDRLTACAQLAQEPLRERRLAGAIEPLDRDQLAAGHGGDGSVSRMADVGTTQVTALPGIDAHPHARAVLTPALPPAGRPSHAYLFYGPSGTGKRTVARAFAAALLTDGARDPGAVAERIRRGTHPDLTWVTPSGAAEMLVVDIEEPVVAAAARTPFESSRRVFVIEGADAMNDQAANRMLKTLEEPPSFVHLVLLADRREDVLPTIASRCQHVRFDPLPSASIAARLSAARPRSDGAEGAASGDGESTGAGPALAAELERVQACARLALGDGRLAARLASEEGQALRAGAEGFVRSALDGATGERRWIALLDRAKTAGALAGEQEGERLAGELELVASKERKRYEREGLDARRRIERRARTRALDLTLRLSELWLRDVLCLAEGTPECVYAVDRRGELEQDAQGREGGRLREGIELVQDTRLRLPLNVSEELALEALSYRLEKQLGREDG
jgi:DNA polymerase-3 subunit delta'